jgi:DNA-binding MarR family transcriptional regulator
MSSDAVLANEAWESLFRAQVVLMREFAADDVWQECSQNEYAVLYELSKSARGLTMVEINRNILMTQGGVSRLVGRLVERGLVERCADPADRRAARLLLTPAGHELQRTVGRRHARAVATAMRSALDHDQMRQVRDLGNQIVTAIGSRHDTPDTTTSERGNP